MRPGWKDGEMWRGLNGQRWRDVQGTRGEKDGDKGGIFTSSSSPDSLGRVKSTEMNG